MPTRKSVEFRLLRAMVASSDLEEDSKVLRRALDGLWVRTLQTGRSKNTTLLTGDVEDLHLVLRCIKQQCEETLKRVEYLNRLTS